MLDIEKFKELLNINNLKYSYVMNTFINTDKFPSNINFIKPKKLYKYKEGGDYDLLNLEQGDLLFRNPSEFNDPYDGMITRNSVNTRRLVLENSKKIGIHDFRVLYSKEFEQWFNEFQQAFDHSNESFKKEIRIGCFTENNDSMLMWSHYANYHKGFCIEYDYKQLNEHFKYCLGINPVVYIDKLKSYGEEYIVQMIEESMKIFQDKSIYKLIVEHQRFKYDRKNMGNLINNKYLENNRFLLENIFNKIETMRKYYEVLEKYPTYKYNILPLFKFTDWIYEKEWRVIIYINNKNQKEYENLNIRDLEIKDDNSNLMPVLVKTPKPTAIYVGCKAERDLENELKNICFKLNIPLYKMILSKNEAEFKLESIPDVYPIRKESNPKINIGKFDKLKKTPQYETFSMFLNNKNL